jgi:hypothetical protein
MRCGRHLEEAVNDTGRHLLEAPIRFVSRTVRFAMPRDVSVHGRDARVQLLHHLSWPVMSGILDTALPHLCA